MLELQQQCGESAELRASIDYCENVIRSEFRKWFGCEMGEIIAGRPANNERVNTNEIGPRRCSRQGCRKKRPR